MWYFLIACILASLVATFWAMNIGPMWVRRGTQVTALLCAICVGYSFGAAWERMRCEDMYVLTLSRYSNLLNHLTATGQSSTVTNVILEFDRMLRAGTKPVELQKFIVDLEQRPLSK